MTTPSTSVLSRRQLLVSTAVAGAGTMLIAACGGSDDSGGSSASNSAGAGSGGGKGDAKEVLPKPATFQQAPMLADVVKAGKLPKVEDRLPENPYVVPHNWVTRGKYGGLVHIDHLGIGQLVHCSNTCTAPRSPASSTTGSTSVPGLAEKWEVSADAEGVHLPLPQGAQVVRRASRGPPQDVMYWWEDMVLNEQQTDTRQTRAATARPRSPRSPRRTTTR